MGLIFTGMKSKATIVPAEVIIEGFLAWAGTSLSNESLPGYEVLGRRIAKAFGGESKAEFDRIADRMVQKLRKGAYIQLNQRTWYLTDRGENLRDALLANRSEPEPMP